MMMSIGMKAAPIEVRDGCETRLCMQEMLPRRRTVPGARCEQAATEPRLMGGVCVQ